MIKILFLIHDLGHGGAEKVLVNLVNNIDKRKFDVTVISLFGGGVNSQFLQGEVKYRYCFKREIRGNSHFMKIFSPTFLYKCLIKEEFDIVVSYLEGPSARIISGAKNNAKKICWIHCTMRNKKQIAKSFRSFSETVNCYEAMDSIVFVSEGVRQEFKKIIPSIKDGGILYNTNETDLILGKAKEKISEDVERLFQNKDLKLCYVGKLTKNKGVERIARIHVRLKQSGYNVHTYVIGTGEEEENIRKYISENRCEESFSLLGFQVNPYCLMVRCDWFVCSSFAEGFSTAATEALVLGVPVLTTNVSGMREMLGDNDEYGIIVDNNEEALYIGIEKILRNPKLNTIYKQKARERGKYFSKDRTVKEVENFLERQI